jgi:hypothetical protein
MSMKLLMGIFRLFIVTSILAVFAGCGDDSKAKENENKGATEDTYDAAGKWDYNTQLIAPIPEGYDGPTDGTGTLDITTNGSTFTLVMDEDTEIIYEGTIAGNTYTAVRDWSEENSSFTDTITFDMSSPTALSGTFVMECIEADYELHMSLNATK